MVLIDSDRLATNSDLATLITSAEIADAQAVLPTLATATELGRVQQGLADLRRELRTLKWGLGIFVAIQAIVLAHIL